MMKKLSSEALKEQLKERKEGALLPLREILVENADLSGWNMDHVDFSLSTFRNVCFDGASLKTLCLISVRSAKPAFKTPI